MGISVKMLEEKNKGEQLTLIAAAWKEHTKTVKTLLTKSPKVNVRNKYNKNSGIALIFAAQEGNTDSSGLITLGFIIAVLMIVGWVIGVIFRLILKGDA